MRGVKASLLLLISVGLCRYSRSQIKTFFQVKEKLNWTQAVDRCLNTGSYIASILSASENIEARPLTGKSWTGLIRAWTWALNGDSQFPDSPWELYWGAGEPRAGENCTALTTDGKWMSKPCTTSLQYASCYSAFDQMHHIVEGVMDWGEARKICQSVFTDLSSARDRNQITAILAAYKTVNQSATSPIWIGLSWRWKWWDESLDVWSGWQQDPSDPDKGCMLLEDNGDWTQEDCSKLYEATCSKDEKEVQQVEKKIQRTKVKLHLNPGSADLSDPVVQQALLNQIGQRLQKSGVTGVKLSWGQCKKKSSKTTSPTDCALKVR